MDTVFLLMIFLSRSSFVKIKLMKNKTILYVLIVFITLFFACKSDLYDSVVEGDHPFGNTTGGEVYKTFRYDSTKAVLLKIPKWSEWNIFLQQNDKESFLTNLCVMDCNEKLEIYKWSKDGLYFAMLIEDSNRYKKGTRLFLFDFTNNTIIRKVDVKDPKIRTFRFGEKAFYYTNDKNEETMVGL